MARIRSVKPEFWTDEKVVELPAYARLLFIGIWNFCDDEGRMVYSPKRMKMQIFPGPGDRDLDIEGLVRELRGMAMVKVYTVDGTDYLQVLNFAKHQKIDKRSPSKLPSPPGASASPEISPTPTEDSPTPPESPRIPPNPPDGREGKGRERIKEAGVPPTDPGGSASFDPKKFIFTQGVQLLVNQGEAEKSARSFLAQYATSAKIDKLVEVIEHGLRDPPLEAKSYIAAAMAPKKRELAL